MDDRYSTDDRLRPAGLAPRLVLDEVQRDPELLLVLEERTAAA